MDRQHLPEPERSVVEALAELEHEQWAHWTRYMLDVLGVEERFDAIDEEEAQAIRRWRRQIRTPYHELSESEKESDREWGNRALAIMLPYVQHAVRLATEQTTSSAAAMLANSPPISVVVPLPELLKKAKAVVDAYDQVEFTDSTAADEIFFEAVEQLRDCVNQ